MQVVLEGRYVLGRELGLGGHAHVFEAKDLRIGRPVAVKMLSTAHPEAAKRLEREGRIAASLTHPNVCSVTDIGRTEQGAPFLVLERLVGETLEQCLKRSGRIHVDAALPVAQELLAALSAAHQVGIIHRDVKPSNVFLTGTNVGHGLVKLLDFGTAQVPGMPDLDGEQLTNAGFVVGTAAYMSPEQLQGARTFDSRSDVYSAGVVLFEMLGGSRPFAGRPLQSMLAAIASERPPSIATVVSGLPKRLVEAIDRALSVKREDRHADPGAFLRELIASAPSRKVDIVEPAVKKSVADEWDFPTQKSNPRKILEEERGAVDETMTQRLPRRGID